MDDIGSFLWSGGAEKEANIDGKEIEEEPRASFSTISRSVGLVATFFFDVQINSGH